VASCRHKPSIHGNNLPRDVARGIRREEYDHAGHIPLPFHAAYSATKFALNAIGKAARVELKNDGIHVLTVCPGYVRTGFSENSVRGNDLKRVRPASVRGITADRVAAATLQGYLKQKREVIVPWTMHVPVKLYQLFPGLVEWAMGRMAN